MLYFVISIHLLQIVFVCVYDGDFTERKLYHPCLRLHCKSSFVGDGLFVDIFENFVGFVATLWYK